MSTNQKAIINAASKRKPLPKLKTLSNTREHKRLGGQDVGITVGCRVTLALCNTKPCSV
jgi:hypothetical protein